ncbi:quinidine resistance protein 2 [Diutina catenulata]
MTETHLTQRRASVISTSTQVSRWSSVSQLQQLSEEAKEEFPHTIFTTPEKYFIVALAGISGFWSTISSPIYLPVLPVLEHEFGVSEERMNLSVVVYSIFQGFSPVIFSTLSDQMGRRVIILTCLLVYVLANIGLATNSNFAGLMGIRCLQAFGVASTVTVSAGIASDLTLKADRASFIGLCTGLSLLGQAFGALIGGMISSSLGWRAIFWFLAISAGVTEILVYIFLPETTRSIVGNGSILPKRWRIISVAPVLKLKRFRSRLLPPGQTNSSLVQAKAFTMFGPFRILSYAPVILILTPMTIGYALWLMMLTTLSTSLTKDYHYSTSQVALAYIPSGIGGLIGTVSIGKILDWTYRTRYEKYSSKIKEESPNHEHKFNIFRARLVVASLPTFLCAAGSLIFGSAIQYTVNESAMMISSFMIAMGAMMYLTISTTVLVDLYPTQSSGSSSCVNLTRCWCAAIFIALLTQMIDAMSVFGCYGFMAALCATSGLCAAYLYWKSEDWV